MPAKRKRAETTPTCPPPSGAGLLSQLQLQRLGADAEAGLLMTSLPVLRRSPQNLALGGQPTGVLPLGHWHDLPVSWRGGTPTYRPRRLLLFADGGNTAPATLNVARGNRAPRQGSVAPEAAMERFAESPDAFAWERHLLKLSWGGTSIGLALGLRTGAEVHWWEACRLVTRRVTPWYQELEFGGAIPLKLFTFADFQAQPGYRNEFLHNHNWLNGHLYVRLHHNGVCEVYAHHVNAKFFDDGKVLAPAVPVVGIRRYDGGDNAALLGPWDGSRTTLEVGTVRFDLSEPARLATTAHPGSLTTADDFLVWQPYEGVEWYGGVCPQEQTGDPWLLHPEQQVIPRGTARTLRFSLSLNPERSPRVARYLAPAWWFGLCEEFMAAPLLPVESEFEDTVEMLRKWGRQWLVKGGFEDGLLPRHGSKDGGRAEAGWEGEAPYAMLLLAWRNGNADDYAAALRACYAFTDIAIDHAAKLVRMHGYPPPAVAIPMARIHACVGAWLETGDEYPRQAAEAVVLNSCYLHRNSWPRLGVGRDACFIRGLVLLYRYTGDTIYRRLAAESIEQVVASQMPEGCFGDQGGGSGLHQWGGYIVKPWMGCMAVGGLVDYLELFPDCEPAWRGVKAFADWLMRERFDHDGVLGWSYQHYYRGGRRDIQFYHGAKEAVLPTPGLWHQEYLARILLYCSLRTGDPAYYAAWHESYLGTRKERGGDHGVAQVGQYLPWLEAWLWQAGWRQGQVQATPVWLGAGTPRQAVIHTPRGVLKATWPNGQRPAAPKAPGAAFSPRYLGTEKK